MSTGVLWARTPLKNVLARQRSIPLSAVELDSEQLRINAALIYIREFGNLDDYPGAAGERRGLMVTAIRRGLVAWDRGRGRYELTGLGKAQSAGATLNPASSVDAVRIAASSKRVEDESASSDRAGQQAALEGDERRKPTIGPVAALAALAACGGIAAGLYFGTSRLASVEVPASASHSETTADASAAPAAVLRASTTAIAPAGISAGRDDVPTKPTAIANATVAATAGQSLVSAPAGPASPVSGDVESGSPLPISNAAQGPNVGMALAIDEAEPGHRPKLKHYRHHHAHRMSHRYQFEREGYRQQTPWYWYR